VDALPYVAVPDGSGLVYYEHGRTWEELDRVENPVEYGDLKVWVCNDWE